MKQFLWLFTFAVLLGSCAETQDEKAAPLMSHIEALYEAGLYRQALDSIMELRKDYPDAIESRRNALRIWQNASLKMAQLDIAHTDSALQTTIKAIETEKDLYTRNLLGVKRDSLQARYEAMCSVVRMIHIRQNEK